MAIVLLHVAHDSGAVDVAVPDDQPLSALMPQLLAAAGLAASPASAWRLAQPGRSPLGESDTLQGAGVGSGVTLRLLPAEPALFLDGAGVAPAASDRDQTAPFAATLPRLRTRAALPERHSGLARVAQAVGAAFSGAQGDPATTPQRAGDLSPAALTRERRLGPLGRARRSWAMSDYVSSLEQMVTAPRLVRCVTIAVMSPKGGVGKTTITTLLGMLLAQLRRDRIVAIDTNPDYGSLGRTLAPGHNVFVDDLLEVLEHPALTVTQLDTSLARAQHGLLVLPAPTDPERMARLDEQAYRRVIGRLQEMVSVIVLDCGTGLGEPAARAALASADQIVLVSDAEPATASLVAEASEQLRRTNVPAILVVNKMSGAGRLDLDRFADTIDWASGLVTLADERGAAASIATADFSWERAPRSWRVSARELAAVIADDWGRIGLTL